MNRTRLILAGAAVIALNLVFTSLANAQTHCPRGSIWDPDTKKCVSVPRGSSG